MELLAKYQNGNVEVCLYDDGTKTQEWEGIANPIFPNSMDVKITNYCDLGCAFCHEMSTVKGEHADLNYLFNILYKLPKGTELAIGGGNPLDHPQLLQFLRDCKDAGLICNMTINAKHIISHTQSINFLIENKLIYGLGISIDESSDLSDLLYIHNVSNVVYHVIAGVSDISILNKIKESPVKKVLILGYKEVGRGIAYYGDEVHAVMEGWHESICHFLGKMHLSFDNLAITQLEVKRFLPKKKWDSIYMGGDGQFTMYIDAVKKEFAVSSTSKQRFPLKGTIEEFFSTVRNVSNNALVV